MLFAIDEERARRAVGRHHLQLEAAPDLKRSVHDDAQRVTMLAIDLLAEAEDSRRVERKARLTRMP